MKERIVSYLNAKIEVQIYIAVSCSHYNPNDKSSQCLEYYKLFSVKFIIVDFKFMCYMQVFHENKF